MRYAVSGLRVENELSLTIHDLYFSKILPALNLKSMEAATVYVAIVDAGRLIL